jgi:tetratricopeptide (TPR) repeat protein
VSLIRTFAATRPGYLAVLLAATLFRVEIAHCEGAQRDSEKSSVPSDAALAEAKSLLQQGKLNEAEHWVRQSLQTQPQSADAHFLLGYILFREITAAEPIADQYSGFHEPDPKLRNAKAGESLTQFTEGAKYHDPSAFDLKIVALDYMLLGSYTDADKWLSKSLERNPRDPQAWYYLGLTKYEKNRFEEAIGAFKKCLELDSGNVNAEDNLGLSYAGLGRWEDAIAAYQKAIEWQSKSLDRKPGPFLNLGTLLLAQNRAAEALLYLQKAVEISPADPKAHQQLGRGYSALDRLPEAQAELEKAVQIDPQNVPLHFMLGQIYRREGLSDKAKSEFDRAASLNATSRTATMEGPTEE